MVDFAKKWMPSRKPVHPAWESAGAPILVAEPVLEDVKHAVRCLAPLGRPVRVAMSAEEVIDLVRREIIDRAVVATELSLGGDPVIARLTQLPLMKQVIATGPANDPAMEVRARAAGAQVYLPRPVSPEDLRRALEPIGVGQA